MNTATQQPGRVFEEREELRREVQRLNREIETLRASADAIDRLTSRAESAELDLREKEYEVHVFQDENEKLRAELNLLRVVGIAGKKWDDAMRAMDDFSGVGRLERDGMKAKERMALVELMGAIREWRKGMGKASADSTA